MQTHVELRKNAAIDRYGNRGDAWVIVETRSGITLRWFTNEQRAKKEQERINHEQARSI